MSSPWPTDDLPVANTMQGPRRRCDTMHVVTLAQVVLPYLRRLVRDVPAANGGVPAAPVDMGLAAHRILAAFGQCAGVPAFCVDGNDQSLEYWLTLYEAPIRCALRPCMRGFVFVRLSDGPGPVHEMALYYDSPGAEGVLFTPSGYTGSVGPSVVVDRIDLPPSDRLCGYFSHPEGEERDLAGPHLHNCDAMVVCLLVVLSLRFGCRDPQLMADTVRCVMQHVRCRRPPADVLDFLLRLRQWHASLTNLSVTPMGLREWLKIAVDGGHCQYMQYEEDGGFSGNLCDLPVTDGLTWCKRHAPRSSDGSLTVAPCVAPDALVLPRIAVYDNLQVVIHLEYAHRETRWECALETAQNQIKRWAPAKGLGTSRTAVLAGACVRLCVFSIFRGLPCRISWRRSSNHSGNTC